MNCARMMTLVQMCKGKRSAILSDIKSKTEQRDKDVKLLELVEHAQAFLQKIATETQEQLRYQISDIVNLALDACFPNEYEFSVDFVTSRGKTEANLKFLSKRTGKEIDPMNASGGGVVDLVSFALRVVGYSISRGFDNVIILDEPFKFISKDLVVRACEIVKQLSEKLNLQFIVVTHLQEFVDIADKVFSVKKGDDGVSVVRTI